MQVQNLGLAPWKSPVLAAGARPLEQGPADPVDLTAVLSDVKSSPARLRQAIGEVVVQVPAGHAIPSPTLQAALALMQRLNRDESSDPKLKGHLETHLSRWRANGQITVAHQGDLDALMHGDDKLTVIGKEVYPAPPASVAWADLCTALAKVENPPSPPEGKPNRLEEPDYKFWAALHEAGKAELGALADRLSQDDKPLPAALSGQQGMIHRRILAAYPEKATESYFTRFLKPAVRENPADAADTVLAFYGADKLLGELLPLAGDTNKWFCVTTGLEHLERAQRGGQHPSQERVDELATIIARDAGTFENHNALAYKGMGCLAQETIAPETRLALQNSMLGHKVPCWPIGLALDHEPTARVATGTPELQENLWNNRYNQVAQALLVRSELNEMDWARLGLLVRNGKDDRESRLICEAYNRRDLDRKLGHVTPAEGLERLARLRETCGVDESRSEQIFFQRTLREFPSGEYAQLEKAANWSFDATQFLPIVKQAAADGTLRETYDAVEGLLADYGRGVVGGHERSVCALYLSQGERTLEEARQRFDIIGKACPSGFAAIGGAAERTAVCKLLEHIPTESLDGPVLNAVGQVVRQDFKEGMASLEALKAETPEAFGKLLTAAKGLNGDIMAQLIELARTQSPEALDRTVQLMGSPLPTRDALTLAPRAEQLHERGLHAEGMNLLQRLNAVDSGERLKAAEAGLDSLLAGDSLESALHRVLKTMVVGGDTQPGLAIGREGNHVRIGSQRLQIKQRARA